MPLHLGDRGVFVCGPGDIAPWETEPVRARANAGVDSAHKRAPGSGWLVLALCPACAKKRNYCADHGPANWWLTVSGLGRERKTRPKPGVDTGSSSA
jgi:hypothetical protein